ncbi:hypothetical protein K491DRAFT_711278 [Lophiostoma macrostomum CBS 122681]|uniref:Uncharacterized protein n=1 Tax=Lophiostoma macrostomum CBS 122681 TaxID=1314788 RepID=A0A6A6TLU2_9PLEO|nr:hypothetical protein K491DRAFT_711278 [Lophiostoma macrostomum CBS 122681]
MSTISRLQAALAAATNEVVVTAANINFDFSLVKCEAPKEYQPLGNMLASMRKSDAETGTIHVTARKLGALFDGACPSTPALLQAYGSRASEITATAKSAESLEHSEAIFSAYAGVDGTSIWAAATSSTAALHVHLLACMLARIFDAAESVSIWVELVRERKRELANRFENGEQLPFSLTAAAAQNELPRTQLAQWDASARSWLRTADEIMKDRHDQLRVLLKCVDVNVNQEKAVFPSVMEAWRSALTTMENLISGQPQAAMNGSILVALSSWHLYPNMAVFGNQNFEVVMDDEFLSSAGVLSIGFSVSGMPRESGVFWCLSLAHLRHYGRPVQTERVLRSDPTRITFSQFLLCSLGAIISHCRIPSKHLLPAMRFLATTCAAFENNKKLGWPAVIGRTASSYLNATGEDLENIKRLVQYGRRRAKQFLGNEKDGSNANADYFGLGGHVHLLRCFRNHEARIGFLRRIVAGIVSENGLESGDFIIQYHDDLGPEDELLPSRSSGEEGTTTDQPLRIPNRHGSRSDRLFTFGADSDTEEDEDDEDEINYPVCYTTVIPGWCRTFAGLSSSDTSELEDLNKHHHHWVPEGKPPPVSPQDEFCHKYVPERGIRQSRDGSLVLGDSEVYTFFCGFPRVAAVYCRNYLRLTPPVWSIELLFQCHEAAELSNYRLLEQMLDGAPTLLKMFDALSTAASIYKHLPNATVAVQSLDRPILNAKWYNTVLSVESKARRRTQKRNVALAIVAYFDSGTCDLDPFDMDRVLAVSSGDSIYVPRQLVCDPIERSKPRQLKRILGNFGKPGVVLAIPPQEPMMRDVDHRRILTMSTTEFDAEHIDSFGRTSLHLSFTDHHVPLYDHNVKIGQESQVSVVEAFISVRDAGAWIADINILEALNSARVVRLPPPRQCEHENQSVPDIGALSVDTWDDVLDCPEDKFVVRAHGNWLARVAVTSVLVQALRNRKNSTTIRVCQPDTCWQCLWGGDDSDAPLMQAFVY